MDIHFAAKELEYVRKKVNPEGVRRARAAKTDLTESLLGKLSALAHAHTVNFCHVQSKGRFPNYVTNIKQFCTEPSRI